MEKNEISMIDLRRGLLDAIANYLAENKAGGMLLGWEKKDGLSIGMVDSKKIGLYAEFTALSLENLAKVIKEFSEEE